MRLFQARRNLADGYRALAEVGCRPFLVDGTLLGAVREGGFLAHDTDVDLGVFIEHYRHGLPRILGALGFQTWRTFGTPERGFQYSFKRDGVKLDVFFYYDDGERFHAAWKDGQPIRYGYPHFELAALLFLGGLYLAPADPEAFLARKYGPDWRVPVTQWDWAWGPKNAEPWREPCASS